MYICAAIAFALPYVHTRIRVFIYFITHLCVCESPPMRSCGQSSWLQNGDVLCFLWGTNWIYICYVEESRSPLWSSGQSSWLHNGDVLCFLRGTNWIYICYVEESKSSGSCLENREYGCRDPSRWPRGTLYPQKLAITSPTSGGSLGRYSSLADSDHGV
jgi:hypothetical protein